MQKLFTLLWVTMLAMGLATTTSATPTRPTFHPNQVAKGQVMHQRIDYAGKNLMKAPSLANAETVTFKTELQLAGNEYPAYLLAVTHDSNGKLRVFDSNDADSDFEMQLIPGIYDLLLLTYIDDDRRGMIVMTQENVDITEATTATFDTSEATHRCDINLISPSGKSLAFNDGDNVTKCGNSCIDIIIFYNGALLAIDTTFAANDALYYALSNSLSTKFSITQMRGIISAEGNLCITIPIDFSKSSIETTSDGWQMAEMNFQSTPVNNRMNQLYEEVGASPDEAAYTSCKYSAVVNNQILFDNMIGANGSIYNGDKVGVWYPSTYHDQITSLIYPCGDPLFGDNSSIIGAPMASNGDALVPLRLNSVFGWDWICSNNYTILSENPYIPTAPAGGVLGNCSPLLVIESRGWAPTFNFAGRYGENMSIDSFDMSQFLFPEFMDIIGQTNKVSVKINDNEITTERAEYPYDIDWDQQGNWEVNYSTDNILIDGQMPGATSAIMKWNSKSYDATLPSLTALTVIDGQTREVKDRFKSVDDSPYLMFYGADIKANPYSQEETPMFNFAELSNVMVEYATMGDDEFTTLEVEAKPEYNHLEGYGYCYEVDLSAISRSSENGWYDVRISIEDANGSSQVQTISPCFYIADTTGVEKVDEALAESEEYYDLTGRRIVTPEKGSIVICRKGAQVSKMVVR